MAEEASNPVAIETTEAVQSTDAPSTDLTAEVEKWKALSRKNEEQAKSNALAAKRLTEIENANKSEMERAIDVARKEATSEVLSKANARIVNAEIRAAAAGKLANPSAAIRFLDSGDFDVDDDGEVDRHAIDKAIDKLLKDEPYLAAADAQRPIGSGDGGARGTNLPSVDMNQMIRRAVGR